MTYSPIALFVYNRPQHTRQTVEALQINSLAGDSDLIIFADAPKTNQQAEAVREVRQYIHQVDGFKSVTIIEQETNFGLAKSIIDGVTTIVNERGRIIVLEDDLIVTPHFLDYMNRALDKYEREQKVVQISGYMFPVKLEIEEDALFLPLTTSWGWATWKRAWDLFDPDAKGYARVKADSALRKSFNLDGAYDYFSMLEAQLAGRVDSWAVRWQLSAFLMGGLTLYPRHSLVVNSGFDGSGTHGVINGMLSKSGAREEFLPHLKLPDAISVGESWTVVRSQLQSRFSLIDKARKWLKIAWVRCKCAL
jgi:Glycosyl transferase family 2